MSRLSLIKMFKNEPAEIFNKCSKAYELGRADEQAETNKYKKAFQVACELLNGNILHGVKCSDFDDTIYQNAMEKEGFCDSKSYEKYILENLEILSK